MTHEEVKHFKQQIVLEMRKHDRDKEGYYIGNSKTHTYHAGFYDGLDIALRFLASLTNK